ncbi:MAG: agmatine deiminase family protein [Phycisphaerales bacterium]|nr:agmatine deiminase family protein [Phycisphaerales bacterium]
MTRAALAAVSAGAIASLAAASGPILTERGLVYPEGAETPRYLTETEKRFLELSPIVTPRAVTPPPTGPVHCVAEYEPMDGIVVGWEGSTAWLGILGQIGGRVTTTGAARFYVIIDNAAEQTDATNRITAAGGDMSKVVFMTRNLDSIWMRDYGPRYIYQGDVRAVVDHTYNRPRPNDNLFNVFFAAQKGHALYELPLIHGGGNFHLDAAGGGYATRLINNENPSLTEPQIINIWNNYQNLATTLFTPFPTNIDATQHIDMWMQVAGDNLVFISDWPANPGSSQDIICDNAATLMASRGFTVVRVPAYTVSGTHYTFTNMVMCNDLVLVPQYTVNPAAGQNAAAIATIQGALPGKTVVGIAAQGIVTAAGVFHCIVMHVPQHRGGLNPTAYLVNMNGGETVDPGDAVQVTWLSDDDNLVASVDLLLSTDGGATFPTTLATGQARLGSFTWNVPLDAAYTDRARIRVVARDAQNRTGSDDSDANFIINGAVSCPADIDGDNVIGFGDLNILLGNYGQSGPGIPGDIDGDGDVDFADLNILLGLYGENC